MVLLQTGQGGVMRGGFGVGVAAFFPGHDPPRLRATSRASVSARPTTLRAWPPSCSFIFFWERKKERWALPPEAPEAAPFLE